LYFVENGSAMRLLHARDRARSTDHQRELGVTMTRDEKNAMLDQLAIDIATLRADNERRRQARIERGEVNDYDDIAPTTVSKAFDYGDRPDPELIAQSERNYQERLRREQQSSGTMDAATQERWNTWLDGRVTAHIKAHLQSFSDLIGDELGGLIGERERLLAARINVLETEVAKLHAIVSGEIITINSKAKRDAAAA